MIKKFFIISFFLSYINPVQSEITNKLLYKSQVIGKENLKIYKTPLTDNKQIKEIKDDFKSKNDYLDTINTKLAKKNKKRPPKAKFKGPSEEIFKEFSDSVVFIGNKKRNGSGAGFVINHNGKKVITNWHVIEGAKTVNVWLKPKNLQKNFMLGSQESFNAKVIKIDKERDLALLDISGLPKNIKPVVFGNYNNLNVGETVFAIGHPKDLIWSFNSGMVSQIRPNYRWEYRDSRHLANVIQMQTPINPGNSGGPLFNKDKKLVGVNTFTTEGENLNFAVSVNDLNDFLKKPEKKIKENKYIQEKKKGPTWITKKKKKNKQNNIDKKYPNAIKRDMNENGITDIWFLDENNNGKIDAAVIDENEDGIIEAVAFDENENKNFEIFLFDDDLDGNADRADIDKDDNGSTDVVAFDYNQDGKWDKYKEIS